MNPDLDLAIDRIIKAPREAVWRAWTDPLRLAEWWVPQPARCKVELLEPRAGGAFVTSMSEDGRTYFPHLDACFLIAEENTRLVFTNAVDSTYRPVAPQPLAMTAMITLLDHPDGTDYRVLVTHADPEAKALHEKLGFVEGWGTVTAQLAMAAERG
jgi:uncharacterized protein YndB with AHSA1/START domain